MRVLREVRSLVLGETWTVPVGVAVVVGAAAVLEALAPSAWRQWGALALIAGVVAVLSVAVGGRNES